MNMAYKTPPQWIAHWCRTGTFTFKGTQNAPALRKLAFAEDVVEPKRAASGENAPFTSVFVLENGKLQAVLDEAASAVSGTPENDGLKARKHK